MTDLTGLGLLLMTQKGANDEVSNSIQSIRSFRGSAMRRRRLANRVYTGDTAAVPGAADTVRAGRAAIDTTGRHNLQSLSAGHSAVRYSCGDSEGPM